MDVTGPYGSAMHPCLSLQSVIAAYVQGELRFGGSMEAYAGLEASKEDDGDDWRGGNGDRGWKLYRNGTGVAGQGDFVNHAGAGRRIHFQDVEETFVEIVMDTQVSRVAAAEILLEMPQYILLMVMRWQERVEAGDGMEGGDAGPGPSDLSDPLWTSAECILQAIHLFVSLCPTFRVMQTSLTAFDLAYERMLLDALTMVLLSAGSAFGKRRMVEALGSTSENAESGLARDAAAMVDVVPAAIRAMCIFFTEKSRGLENNGKTVDEWSMHFHEEIESGVVQERLELMERGWMFLPAAVEATRTLGQMLLFRMRAENAACFLDAGILAQRLESSLMLLDEVLADQDAFAWFSEKESHVTSLGRLACTVFDLVTHTGATTPYPCRTSAERVCNRPAAFEPLARSVDEPARDYVDDVGELGGFADFALSQMCALLVSVAFHRPSFSDLLSEGRKEAQIITDVMVRAVLALVKHVLLRPSLIECDVLPGEPQLMVNVMRLAEIFSDDSNFKATFHREMIHVIKHVVCQKKSVFRSMWGPTGYQAVLMMCRDEHMVNSTSEELQMNSKSFKKAFHAWMKEMHREEDNLKEWHALTKLDDAELERGMRLAIERVVLLIKLVGNLQMMHEEGGAHTFGGLLAAAIMEMKGKDVPAIVEARENIAYLMELSHELRGEGKIRLVVPLLDDAELRYFELFRTSVDESLG